jgi:rubrerythrin
MALKRFIVEGYYDDPSQVCADIVDAENEYVAEKIIQDLRGDEYTTDGADDLDDRIERYKHIKQKSADEVQADLRQLGRDNGFICDRCSNLLAGRWDKMCRECEDKDQHEEN